MFHAYYYQFLIIFTKHPPLVAGMNAICSLALPVAELESITYITEMDQSYGDGV